MTFTSPLAETLAPDVLERFQRYVRVDTQSQRDRERSPSTPGQLELARMLVEELHAAGLTDAALDEHGYVFATLPGPEGSPVIGVLAHMDVSPDAPADGVVPIVHARYEGGVIELPYDETVLDPAQMPVLAAKVGHDIVTSSGDTLLGADDKAGVAEIMAAVAHLAAHPELPRPTLRVGFTPDEEIGEGATLFDIERFGARCAYTLDGSQPGELQDETFSAVEVTLTVHGVDVHPGLATGRLVNAARLAGRVLAALPSDRLTPETTSGREGFIHPYALDGVGEPSGRPRDRPRLRRRAARPPRRAAAPAPPPRSSRRSRGRGWTSPSSRSTRTCASTSTEVPEVVAAAERAIRAEGLEVLREPIRGGTDGSILSARGLPTPNIFTGGHEYHSVREWASVQDMASASAVVVRLAEAWAS